MRSCYFTMAVFVAVSVVIWLCILLFVLVTRMQGGARRTCHCVQVSERSYCHVGDAGAGTGCKISMDLMNV